MFDKTKLFIIINYYMIILLVDILYSMYFIKYTTIIMYIKKHNAWEHAWVYVPIWPLYMQSLL